MKGPENQAWPDECRSAGIDPGEVERVAGYYDKYRQYTLAAHAEPLVLDRWFRWYHIEKASEAAGQGAAPAGCSVDDQSQGNSLIRQPDVFLKMLKLCVTRSQC